MINAFDRSCCIDGDYLDKVLVLDLRVLPEGRTNSADQLFLAEAGCGCFKASHGHKVFGQFLKTGETAQFDRSDFLGVLRKEYLPDWARDLLEDIREQVQEGQL